MLISLAGLLQCAVLAGLATASTYHEHLTLQPLPQSALLAAFNFKTNISLTDFQRQNYNIFPRSLAQILLHTRTEELHLRFALGRWDADTWGERPRRGRTEGGTGVEIWAWLQAGTDEKAEARWFTLTNALSGLFCASLNFVDRTKTIRPAFTFDREGNTPVAPLQLLYGSLPHEVVCTENLTPFLKLMPCKGKAGISTLLDGHKLFDASWQTMAIDVRKRCSGSEADCHIEIEQTVDMVLDIERSIRSNKDPIPRPLPIEGIACNTSKTYNSHDTCFPENVVNERGWSLKEIFGRPVRGSCPLGSDMDARSGQVEVLVPRARNVTTTPSVQDTAASEVSASSRWFQIPHGVDFDISVDEFPVGKDIDLITPVLLADRTITGYGQERGGMHTILTNPSPAELEVVYLDLLPWFMKPYLHTLKATTTPFPPSSSPSNSSAASALITNILYRPARDRLRGTHLELRLSIPANSRLTLTYDFDKAILRYTEYPPDANRGFDVAPAVIRVLPPDLHALYPHLGRRSSGGPAQKAWGGESQYIRTTSLLLPLPTPDFSMPYNVIILTSTVIAMGFGSIFNLLTRRLVGADEGGSRKLGAVLAERVRGIVAKVRDAARRRRGGARNEGIGVGGGGGVDDGGGGGVGGDNDASGGETVVAASGREAGLAAKLRGQKA